MNRDVVDLPAEEMAWPLAPTLTKAAAMPT